MGIDRILSSLHKRDVIVSDVGNHEFWVSRGYELAEVNNRILYSKSFGALGCSIGKAIGAYYASKRSVICFVGDQGIQLNIQEIQLISQAQLPIAIVLLNNHSSGMIRDREFQKYKGYLLHTTPCTGYGMPDFRLIAKSYGIEYRIVNDDCWKDVEIILKNLTKPILIELLISEEIGLTPSLPKGKPMQMLTPELEKNLYLELDSL